MFGRFGFYEYFCGKKRSNEAENSIYTLKQYTYEYSSNWWSRIYRLTHYH